MTLLRLVANKVCGGERDRQKSNPWFISIFLRHFETTIWVVSAQIVVYERLFDVTVSLRVLTNFDTDSLQALNSIGQRSSCSPGPHVHHIPARVLTSSPCCHIVSIFPSSFHQLLHTQEVKVAAVFDCKTGSR